MVNMPNSRNLFRIKLIQIYKIMKYYNVSSMRNFLLFEKSGFITLRNSWSSKSNYLFLDFGKFGPLHSPL